jgi:hypothetical protein
LRDLRKKKHDLSEQMEKRARATRLRKLPADPVEFCRRWLHYEP